MFRPRLSLIIFCSGLFVSCANKSCRTLKEEEASKGTGQIAPSLPTKKELDPMDKTSVLQRVKVYKPDGSLQCGQGKKIDLEKMSKELKGIQIFSKENKNDGLMRIQVCGAPTGSCNVFQIDQKDSEAALKLGFKVWTQE